MTNSLSLTVNCFAPGKYLYSKFPWKINPLHAEYFDGLIFTAGGLREGVSWIAAPPTFLYPFFNYKNELIGQFNITITDFRSSFF